MREGKHRLHTHWIGDRKLCDQGAGTECLIDSNIQDGLVKNSKGLARYDAHRAVSLSIINAIEDCYMEGEKLTGKASQRRIWRGLQRRTIVERVAEAKQPLERCERTYRKGEVLRAGRVAINYVDISNDSTTSHELGRGERAGGRTGWEGGSIVVDIQNANGDLDGDGRNCGVVRGDEY